MWCKHCQSEVAAELSPERQTLRCTNCGTTLQQLISPSLHPETQAARELLERWAKEQKARREESPAGAAAAEGSRPERTDLPAAKETENTDSPPVYDETSPKGKGTTEPPPSPPADVPAAAPLTGRKIRVDGSHATPDGPNPPHRRPRRRPLLPTGAGAEPAAFVAASKTGAVPVEAPATSADPVPPPEVQTRRRIDARHSVAQGPHFAVPVPASAPVPGRSESLWGQILAYAGVGVLTFGAVLVLWGYFGGIEAYTSTGWLLSTAGQMLLLLGVVTLVAGGMQQTTHEVGQRIDHLGGRIIRIERSTKRILKGPHSRHAPVAAGDTGRSNEEAA